jgi:hypothetical protein
MLELGWLVNHTKVVITSFWRCLVGGRTSQGPTVVAWRRPATYNLRSLSILRLFRFIEKSYLDLNGVNVVGFRCVHGNCAETTVRVARLNGSHGLRSGTAWSHRVGGKSGHSEAGARSAGIRLLHLRFGGLLTG